MRTLLRGRGDAVAVVLLAALVGLRILDPGFVAEIRLRGFDLLQRVWPRPTGAAPIAVVAIDEASLARYGQWPWPRSQLAELVRRLADGKPRVLGIDIIFSEPDRLSPPEILREIPDLPSPAADALKQMSSSEHKLAKAIREVPTVLALVPGHDAAPPSGPVRLAPIRQAGGQATPYLARYSSLLLPLPELAAAAQGTGSIAVREEERGILRRVPLAFVEHDSIFPSLSLEMLSVAERHPIVIHTGPGGIDEVTIGGLAIPTDRRGRAILHFARRLTHYVSAAAVLDGAFDPAQLRGWVVLLGVTGLGVVDQKETPVGAIQGLDIHAQLIESMLLGQLLHRPRWLDWIEIMTAIAAGLAMLRLPRYHRPAEAAGVAGAVIAAALCTELALFRFAGILFDGTYPALATVVGFGVMLVGALRAAETALRREREVKQRMEGELAAAQAIQMGLLPRGYPAFPDRPDIDLCANIEPARMVGGDFYDYLLIDRDRRLFFLIADVSDKGIPAALFMAVTKEVVRDAVLRFAPALDRILAEVNRKTTEASEELPSQGGDMMFVTAFAGILDLETGDIDFASAGHDLPFVVGGNPGVRQLSTKGGPPLGAVEPFPFPVDRDRLAPGEVLVLYTDGITEAQNAARQLYSVERLEMLLATAIPPGDAKRVITAVIEDVRRFVGGAEQADDITLLALRRA